MRDAAASAAKQERRARLDADSPWHFEPYFRVTGGLYEASVRVPALSPFWP
jgi:hypothetical protein